MYNLHQFREFDSASFFSGKDLEVVNVGEWTDHDTGKHMGTTVEVVIIADRTNYKPKSDGTPAMTNKFEKLRVKVPHAVQVAEGDRVELVEPECTVYGDYSNQLSVRAADVRRAGAQPQAAKPSAKSSARPLGM